MYDLTPAERDAQWLARQASHVVDVFVYLANNTCDPYRFVSFAPIMTETGHPRSLVRRACRALARKGLARYERGLWADCGEPAGAGYAVTSAGRNTLEEAPSPWSPQFSKEK